MGQQRFDSIDCAKGIGILLVVFAHVIATYNVGNKAEEFITSFHMPLFFVLSGMLFNGKKSFKEFFIGKINRLLVPFFFFFNAISVSISLIRSLYKGSILTDLRPILLAFINENLYIAGALWFLLSLFFISILFWWITFLSSNKMWASILPSLALGLLGYFMGKNNIDLPCWFDTSLTCMPYFALGYLLKYYTPILTARIPDKYNILLAIACLVCVGLFSGYTCYRANHFNISIWRVYCCGVLGFFSIFLLSKTRANRVTGLLFFGKHSIIVLAIHQLIMMVIAVAFRYVHFDGWWAAMASFTATMACCYLIIPYMLKYMPHVIGQKSLFNRHG